MGTILENYIKQVEEDKKTENYDLPKSENGEAADETMLTEEQRERYKEKLDNLRQAEDEMMKKYKEFQEQFKNLSEKELEGNNKTEVSDVRIRVKRAFCPECNTEIICNMPTVFNPFTNERISRYECPKCHKKYNLEYAYPRFIVVDALGREIKGFLE